MAANLVLEADFLVEAHAAPLGRIPRFSKASTASFLSVNPPRLFIEVGKDAAVEVCAAVFVEGGGPEEMTTILLHISPELQVPCLRPASLPSSSALPKTGQDCRAEPEPYFLSLSDIGRSRKASTIRAALPRLATCRTSASRSCVFHRTRAHPELASRRLLAALSQSSSRASSPELANRCRASACPCLGWR